MYWTSTSPGTIEGFQAATTALLHQHFARYASPPSAGRGRQDALNKLQSKHLRRPYLPPSCLGALHHALSLSIHWDTSALTKSGAPRYTAMHACEARFGAAVGTCRYTGHAGLSTPEVTEEAAITKLKWAILSTYAPEPTLTALLLPALPAPALHRYLTHPRVHKLCTIPRARAQLTHTHH